MKGGNNSNSQNRNEMMHARFRAQFWKTETCRFWRSGCRNADSCPFAHGEEELHQRPDLVKTSLCQRWSKGTCPLEAHECRFAHGPLDLRTTPNYAKPPGNPGSKAEEAPVPSRGGSIQNGTLGAPASLVAPSIEMHPTYFDATSVAGGLTDEVSAHYPCPPPPPAPHPAVSAASRQHRVAPDQGGFRNSHGYAMGGAPSAYYGWDEAGAQKAAGHPVNEEQGSKELLFVGPPPDGQWGPAADALPAPSDLLVNVNGLQRLPGPPPTAAPPPPVPRAPVPLVPLAPPACGTSSSAAGYPARYCDQMSSPDFAESLGMGQPNPAFALNGVNSHDMHNGVRMGWPTNGHAVSRTNGHMANGQMANLFMNEHQAAAPMDGQPFPGQPENQAADYSGPPLSNMPWPGQERVPEELKAIWG